MNTTTNHEVLYNTYLKTLLEEWKAKKLYIDTKKELWLAYHFNDEEFVESYVDDNND